MRKIVICIAVLFSILTACSTNGNEVDNQKTTTTAAEPTTPAPSIEGTHEQKAKAIAEIINQESDGLLMVVRADVPLHGQLDSGEDFFGAHYRVVVTKSVHELTDGEDRFIRSQIAKIFELTTRHILAEDRFVTHMGVQTLYPDIWSLGFAGVDDADVSNVCVAGSRDLLNVASFATAEGYLATAICEKLYLVRQSQLGNG